MTWKQAAREELSKFDIRIVIVFAIACLVIVTSQYFFRSPADYFLGSLGSISHDALILYKAVAWHLGTFFMLFVMPFVFMVLLNRFSIRKLSPVRYTFTLGDYKAGIKFVLIFVVVTVSGHLIQVASGIIPIDFYPSCKSGLIQKYFWVFLLYEFTQLLYMMSFEYFYRGFMLLEAEAVFGYNALAVTLLPYIIIKLGKPPVEVYTAILVGIALAYMTIRTRSFVYAALSHGLLAMIVDFIGRFSM